MGERRQCGFSEVPLGFGIEHLQQKQAITLALYVKGPHGIWQDTNQRLAGIVTETQPDQGTFSFLPQEKPDIYFASTCATSISLVPFEHTTDSGEYSLCFVAIPTPPTDYSDTLEQ